MQYGLNIVTLGDYADPRNVLRLAEAAETAGWEGLFVWDHMGFVWGAPAGDPWVILAAVASCTSRLKLGVGVAPLPRYSPQVLARILATLDLLSDGRLIFGAGIGGVPEEFTAFGESGDLRRRAAMLDEGLEILDRFMSGEAVDHQGTFYTVDNVTLAPLPLQRPRLPVWIGGESRAALHRAAHWDGWITGGDDEAGKMVKTPEQLLEQVNVIRKHRPSGGPFDVAISGISAPSDGALTRAYEEAGATWWLESLHGFRGSIEDLLRRVEAGPPST
jgi:alkanesulfonate monooxygenase SsuD/methylene tetrahydromethanopterin reductase-like flavin-dependent oxidoreductase (luciferase family)